MITMYRKHSSTLGLLFTVAVGLFGYATTWILFGDSELFARVEAYLWDLGVDTFCAFISAALYYGCMRQKGEGADEFRALNVLVSAGFLANMLVYYTIGVPEMIPYAFLFIMASKLIDLVMIWLFYRYVRISLSLRGKLAAWADRWMPILMVLQSLAVLSNIIYPTTFFIDAGGSYQATGASWAEDIFLIVASLITIVLTIRSDRPRNQKAAVLTFIFLPLFNYLTTLGEFGNASQYGMVLMSLIIMYCVIFNYNSNKLVSTQTELNMATEIQMGMLPSIFPAFPKREEFDLYASMDPAKEVGGDFYDFFMIDDDHLGVVIADVSGKGVPAALFMMISKTVIQNFAKLGIRASDVLNKSNEALCSDNKAEMFVTTWIGILEISTGKMTCASAGHEYPAIYHNGKFELYKDRHGLVLGGMEGAVYKEYELHFAKGDMIFVYTDGVPEAANINNEFFGTDRMIDALNRVYEPKPKAVLEVVRNSVDEFVGGAEQFDDLTMLCLEYRGNGNGSGNSY